MDFLGPAISLGTSALSSAISIGESRKNRRFARDQAATARQWSEQMSNTEVQRRRRDLVAAGINPILAANMSGGSGTPSAASASPAGLPSVDIDSGYTPTTASELKLQKEQRTLLQAQQRDVHAGADLKVIDAQTQGLRNITDIDKSIAEIDRITAETNLSKERRENVIEERKNLIALRDQISANIRNLNTSSDVNSARVLTEKSTRAKIEEEKRGQQIDNKRERAFLSGDEEAGKLETLSRKKSHLRGVTNFLFGTRRSK